MENQPVELRFTEKEAGEDYSDENNLLLHSWKPEDGAKGFEVLEFDSVSAGQLRRWEDAEEHTVLKISPLDVADALSALLAADSLFGGIPEPGDSPDEQGEEGILS